jgi:hypothetical protein
VKTRDLSVLKRLTIISCGGFLYQLCRTCGSFTTDVAHSIVTLGIFGMWPSRGFSYFRGIRNVTVTWLQLLRGYSECDHHVDSVTLGVFGMWPSRGFSYFRGIRNVTVTWLQLLRGYSECDHQVVSVTLGVFGMWPSRGFSYFMGIRNVTITWLQLLQRYSECDSHERRKLTWVMFKDWVRTAQ